MLKKHIQDVHDGFKYRKCDSCGKSFSEARYLMKHIQKFHENQMDHKCKSCGKVFVQAGKLMIYAKN